MTEPISDPLYWKRRLQQAQQSGQLHHSIFRCSLDRWKQIEAKHCEILARLIQPTDSILDAGCGYGRLLTLLPSTWHGIYLGMDLSGELISLARERHPEREFRWVPLEIGLLQLEPASFDWAVLISMRPMIRRNLGDEHWQTIERELQRVSRRRLYLEYDPDDEGSVE